MKDNSSFHFFFIDCLFLFYVITLSFTVLKQKHCSLMLDTKKYRDIIFINKDYYQPMTHKMINEEISMKIIKYNLSLLDKRKMIYVVLVVLILFSLCDVLIIFQKMYHRVDFIENCLSADYLFLLTYPFFRVAPLLIFGLPVLFSLSLSDATWTELQQGNSTFLYTRLDYVKNIWVRYFLSVVIVFLLSFFCFFLNYLSFKIIFGNENALTVFQTTAFLQEKTGFFLDSIRQSDVILYSILLICHVSIIYGLLAGITYTLSFLFKSRLQIYFSSILFMIAFEIMKIILGLGNVSIILQLQPFSSFMVEEALILYLFLFLIGIGMLCFFLFKKRDIMQ